jgi:hypothetical protein
MTEETIITEIPDLGQPVPAPWQDVAWMPKDITAWSVRRAQPWETRECAS